MSDGRLPRLYLHIGSPKTGTTSFQHFMNENFDFLLNELKLYYPFCERDNLLLESESESESESAPSRRKSFSISEIRHSNGQRILACADPFSLVMEIGRLAKKKNLDVVISDEDLSASSHPHTPFLTELKRWFDVIPVIVIKDPLDYIYGSYLQTIKGSPYSGSFEDFLISQPAGSVQFRFYREWCEAFDSLKVLSFKAIKTDLIRSLLMSFERSSTDLGICEDGSSKRNVSLSAECYEVIRRLNHAGLHVLARSFSLLQELAPQKGQSPEPNPNHADAAYALHDGMFDYLRERFGFPHEAFMSTASAQLGAESDSADRGISIGNLDILLAAVKGLYSSGLAEEQEPPAASSSSLCGQQLPCTGYEREGSPWSRFCPAEFSPDDYVALGGLLNTLPHEALEEFDPFRHYVMRGRYAGYAIKKNLSVHQQLKIFSNSPFSSYVPPDFDAASYLLLNADVQQAGVDPYHHYWAYGIKEMRAF